MRSIPHMRTDLKRSNERDGPNFGIYRVHSRVDHIRKWYPTYPYPLIPIWGQEIKKTLVFGEISWCNFQKSIAEPSQNIFDNIYLLNNDKNNISDINIIFFHNIEATIMG
jgi:hypothetical protein